MPTNLKSIKPIISLFGLCSVTYPKMIRMGDLFGGKLGIYEVNDPICSTEFREELSLNLATQIFDNWLKNQPMYGFRIVDFFTTSQRQRAPRRARS